MKNAIIIENHKDNKIIIPVKNFSDENVKEAIRKVLVDVENLDCLSSCLSYGIYGIKNPFLTVLNPIEGLSVPVPISEYSDLIHVTFAKLIS